MRRHIAIILTVVTVIATFLVPFQSTFADEEKHHVLFLQSYDSQNSWARDVSQGFFEKIDLHRSSVLVHEEFMDTKRRRSEEHLENFTAYFKEKYKNVTFSVIVTADNNAFNYVREIEKELFDDIPVVFVGLNPTEGNSNLPERYSGVYESVKIDETLKLISDIHPDESKILIVTDETVTGQAVLGNVRNALDNFKGNQAIEFYMSSNLDAIEEKLNGLSKLDAVLFLLFNADDQGNSYTYNEGLDEIFERSPSAIYGMWKFYLSNGIVGGYLTDGFEHGSVAAEYVISKLQGTVPDPDLLEYVEPDLYFDYKELKRFGLESIAVPNNAIMINRPTDNFRDLAPMLIAVSITTALITLIIALWYMNRKEHMMNEHLNSERERLEGLINKDLDALVNERTEALLLANQHCEVLKDEYELLQGEHDSLKSKLVQCNQNTNNVTFGSEKLRNKFVEIDIGLRLYSILLIGILKSSVHIKELLMEIGISNEKIDSIESIYKDGTMKRSDLENYFKNRKRAIGKFEDRIQVLLNEHQKFVDIEWVTNFESEISQKLSMVINHASDLAMIENSNQFIEIEKSIDLNLPTIEKPAYIAYVIIQLVSNALTHAFKDDSTGKLEISAQRVDGLIDIRVSDNGVGMDNGVIQQAELLFYTTESEYGHFGIGLSNVKQIVEEKYSGEILIESEIDRGTTITIKIPDVEVDDNV